MNKTLYTVIAVLCFHYISLNQITLLYAQTKSSFDSSVKDELEIKMNEALLYYKKSVSQNQNPELSKEYLEISKNKIKVVELTIENRLLYNEKISLEKKLMSLQTDELRIQDEIKKNIALVRDRKNQETIAEELLYKNSLDKLDEALTSINNAEDADATIYTSNIIHEARINYDTAKKNFDEGIYDESILYSQKSIDMSLKALEISNSNKQKIDNLNSSLQNIFGFKTNINNSYLILSSGDVFLPMSSTIRFDLYPSLDKIAEILSEYENLTIEVESYDISSKNRNKLDISPEQSRVIKSYLVTKGLTKNIVINENGSIPEELVSKSVNLILKY